MGVDSVVGLVGDAASSLHSGLRPPHPLGLFVHNLPHRDSELVLPGHLALLGSRPGVVHVLIRCAPV